MKIEKIQIVRDFIDFTYIKYTEEVYKFYRRNKFSISSIQNEFDWFTREDNFLSTDGGDFYEVSEHIENFIEDYYDSDLIDIKYGGEQFAFIFPDYVIKASHTDCYKSYQYVMREAGEYARFFCPCKFLECYKGIYIYSQERVKDYPTYRSYYVETPQNQELLYWVQDEVLCSMLEEELDYDDDKIKNFISFIRETGATDLHEENWGINEKGEIRIFDPIFG